MIPLVRVVVLEYIAKNLITNLHFRVRRRERVRVGYPRHSNYRTRRRARSRPRQFTPQYLSRNPAFRGRA